MPRRRASRPETTAGLSLAWETDDAVRLRGVLDVAGFREAADGALEIDGLRVVVRPSSATDRLILFAMPGPTDGAAARWGDPGPGGVRLRALAIAVVDTERAARAFRVPRAELSGGASAGRSLPDDALLGARVATTGTPGIVLAEPVTEGRLAATLARHGEGPAALYLSVPAPATGTATALDVLRAALAALGERPRQGVGPFGAQLLARSRPPWGPHLLVVPDTVPGCGRATGGSATIVP